MAIVSLKKDKIFLTGSTGFVGSSIRNMLKGDLFFYTSGGHIPLEIDVMLHFAGKAHHLKQVSNQQEYYEVNTELTKKVFDAFLKSHAKVFITLSSVKAIADTIEGELNENHIPKPMTHYGKSKLLAEQYILSKNIPEGKRVYILRPCMIYGNGNKGNLKLLYQWVSKGIPWPLGAFKNYRSFCSIENLLFIIKELTDRCDIPSGVYNVADDLPLSTNDVIRLIAEAKDKKAKIWNLNKSFIIVIARIGDLLKLPLNTERLQKLTENYIVCNDKIKKALGKPLPITSIQGLRQNFHSYYTNV